MNSKSAKHGSQSGSAVSSGSTDKYLTVADIAEFTSMSERQVWRWIRCGNLAAYEFGRAVRVKQSELEQFAARCRKKN